MHPFLHGNHLFVVARLAASYILSAALMNSHIMPLPSLLGYFKRFVKHLIKSEFILAQNILKSKHIRGLQKVYGRMHIMEKKPCAWISVFCPPPYNLFSNSINCELLKVPSYYIVCLWADSCYLHLRSSSQK